MKMSQMKMSNAKLRAHLALVVPAADTGGGSLERTGLRVGNRWETWVEGKVIVFDDSFEHEVWWRWPPTEEATEGDVGRRIVLIVDVFHPGLTAGQLKALRASL